MYTCVEKKPWVNLTLLVKTTSVTTGYWQEKKFNGRSSAHRWPTFSYSIATFRFSPHICVPSNNIHTFQYIYIFIWMRNICMVHKWRRAHINTVCISRFHCNTLDENIRFCICLSKFCCCLTFRNAHGTATHR